MVSEIFVIAMAKCETVVVVVLLVLAASGNEGSPSSVKRSKWLMVAVLGGFN